MLASLPYNKIQFFDDNGDPLDGGWLYTCLPAGTIADPKATWQDAAGTMLNSNPIHLDSAGRATVFLDGFYHIFLEKSDHTAVWDVDNISAMAFVSSVSVEWVASTLVPTLVSGTSFTVPGNHTADLPVGLRVKVPLTGGGTIYGTVSSVSAGGGPVVTTVTIIPDSGSLAAFTTFYTGILTPVYLSSPVIPVSAKNSTQVLSILDLFRIIVGTNTVSMNFTLPTTVPSGSWVRIKNAGTADIILIGTINGLVNPTLSAGGDVMLFHDGSAWYGLFYDAAHGSFTTSLKVGSGGGFPAFQVDNNGDITVSGGADAIWNLLLGATPVLQVGNAAAPTNRFTILTRGYVSVAPTDALEIANKKYVDDADAIIIAAANAATALAGIKILPGPGTLLNTGGIYSSIAVDRWLINQLTAASLNWTTLGANILGSGYFETSNVKGTADGTGGWFHNLYVNANTYIYFHFFNTIIIGTAGSLFTLGVRLGFAAPTLSGGASAQIDKWLTNTLTPSAFSTAYTTTRNSGAFGEMINYFVIGPVAVTPGWYSIFVQAAAYGIGGGGGGDILNQLIVDGGIYITLSAT